MEIKNAETDRTGNTALTKYKLLMLGDAGVGKTSISRRYVNEAFQTTYIHTIGIDFLEKVIDVKGGDGDDGDGDGKRVKLQIWDTAGQDRFRSIIRPYYRGASGILLVYDVTDERTFENIRQWMTSIEENTDDRRLPAVQKVIVGNKVDLDCGDGDECGLRRVSTQEGRELAAKYEDVPFFEVSAKDGSNVDMAFETLAGMVHKARLAHPNDPTNHSQFETVELDAIPIHTRKEKKSRCGCS